MTTPIEKIPVSRLREECKHLHLRHVGVSRAELITDLQSHGLTEVDLRFPAKPPRVDTSDRSDDLSNVYLGNGAGLNTSQANRLYISNDSRETPLIGGCFKTQRVDIHNILNIRSCVIDLNDPAEEGDIKREDGELYMYRSTSTEPGWYPLKFGTIKLV
jgi:hypothetical protein